MSIAQAIKRVGFCKYNIKTSHLIFFNVGNEMFSDEISLDQLNIWLASDYFTSKNTPFIKGVVDKVVAYINILSEFKDTLSLVFKHDNTDYLIEMNNTYSLIGIDLPIIDIVISEYYSHRELSINKMTSNLLQEAVISDSSKYFAIDTFREKFIFDLAFKNEVFDLLDIFEGINKVSIKYPSAIIYAQETLNQFKKLRVVGDKASITVPYFDEKEENLVFYEGYMQVSKIDSENQVSEILGKIKLLSNVEVSNRVRNYFDDLTHLKNRRTCKEEVNEIINQKNYGYCLVIDLDNLKQVNEKYGHRVGDTLIMNHATLILEFFSYTSNIYRYAGNEFIVFIKNEDMKFDINATISQYLEIMRNEEYYQDNVKLDFSACVGAFKYDETCDTITRDEIISNAHIAMYIAKSSGKGSGFVASPDDITRFNKNIRFEADVLDSVYKKKYIPYYLPIVALDTGEMIGVEALARLRHHEWGLVSGDRFMNVVSFNEDINILDFNIFEKTIRDYQNWKSSGIISEDFKLSFNVGIDSLTELYFDSIKYLLLKYNVDPAVIYLEIDSRISQSKQSKIDVLNKFIDDGFSLAITNYSISDDLIKCIKLFNIREVKIKKEIALDLINSKINMDAYKYLRDFAKLYKINVVAEGIEDDSQVKKLLDIGIEVGQGYYFGLPVCNEDLIIKLKT